jgi:flagellar motility protein MotE (MotC chaperone)
MRAAPAAARPGPDPAAQEQALKQLAKIYAAMKPAQAAAVLTRMSDGEVKNILTHLSTRQAGTILGLMPRDRAARLSDLLLKTSSSGS